MAELLEQIKKLPREEQLALIQQVWDLESAPPIVLSPEERNELEGRGREAAINPLGGTPWAELKARMLSKMQGQQK